MYMMTTATRQSCVSEYWLYCDYRKWIIAAIFGRTKERIFLL